MKPREPWRGEVWWIELLALAPLILMLGLVLGVWFMWVLTR